MIINTYTTHIEIAGYEYEVKVNYQGEGDSMEILDVQVKNEHEEWIGMPYLIKVEGDIWEEIWNSGE